MLSLFIFIFGVFLGAFEIFDLEAVDKPFCSPLPPKYRRPAHPPNNAAAPPTSHLPHPPPLFAWLFVE